MITPVGANAEMTAAMVKAVINQYQGSNIINKQLHRAKMASVPEEALSPLKEKLQAATGLTSRQRRMLRLTSPALHEVMAHYKQKQPLPLFLAVPESLPTTVFAVSGSFIKFLKQQSDVNLDLETSRVLATGRAGGIQALDIVFKYFAATGLDYALVGGVDTYRDLNLLAQLDADDRLRDEGIFDGFVPGEAAGFLLLASEKARLKLKSNHMPCLYQPGLGSEEGHRYSKATYTGDGLANSFNYALENAVNKPISSIYSSLNGESFGVKEFGIASIRNSSSINEAVIHEHPADCFGDIGAAFAPVLIGLITNSAIGNSNHIACCSSENEYRGAVCVQT